MDEVNQIPVHREPDFGVSAKVKWELLPKKMTPLIFGGTELDVEKKDDKKPEQEKDKQPVE